MVRFLLVTIFSLLSTSIYAAAFNPEAVQADTTSDLQLVIPRSQLASWKASADEADKIERKYYSNSGFGSAVAAGFSGVGFAFSWFILFEDRCPDGYAPLDPPAPSAASNYVDRSGFCFDLDDATRAEVYSHKQSQERLEFLRSLGAELVGPISLAEENPAAYAVPAAFGVATLALIGYSRYAYRQKAAPGRHIRLLARLTEAFEYLKSFASESKSTTL